MTDYTVLGLSENFTFEELKKAFRNKSKSFHPDKNNDSYKSHLAMIRVNQAYTNLIGTVTEPSRKKESNPEKNAYKIYKEGIAYFQSIHPSKWKKLNKNDLFNAHAIETDPESVRILDELIEIMAKAYHCFSIVRNEYPDSCWHNDSIQKIRDIEKMTVRYAKIKKSYESETAKIV